MINPKRVRRIKNVIYALIILILLVPFILMLTVGLQLLDVLRSFDAGSAGTGQNAANPAITDVQPQDTRDSGYLIDPTRQNNAAGEASQDETASPDFAGEPDGQNPDEPSQPDAQPGGESQGSDSGVTGAGQGETPPVDASDVQVPSGAGPGGDSTGTGDSPSAPAEGKGTASGGSDLPNVLNPATGLGHSAASTPVFPLDPVC